MSSITERVTAIEERLDALEKKATPEPYEPQGLGLTGLGLPSDEWDEEGA